MAFFSVCPGAHDANVTPQYVLYVANQMVGALLVAACVSGEVVDDVAEVAAAGRFWLSSARMARAARSPNTNPSRSELLASRLAPCTPVHAASPAA